jgi:hypothetical protein
MTGWSLSLKTPTRLPRLLSLEPNRLGPTDARILAQEFAPEFEASDLTSLPNHEIYVRLVVEGSMPRPFSGETVKL